MSGTNVAPFDGWTVAHAATGAASGALGVPFWLYALGAIGYELAEYSAEYPHGSPLFGTKRPESIVNVAADMGVGLMSYAVGRFIVHGPHARNGIR